MIDGYDVPCWPEFSATQDETEKRQMLIHFRNQADLHNFCYARSTAQYENVPNIATPSPFSCDETSPVIPLSAKRCTLGCNPVDDSRFLPPQQRTILTVPTTAAESDTHGSCRRSRERYSRFLPPQHRTMSLTQSVWCSIDWMYGSLGFLQFHILCKTSTHMVRVFYHIRHLKKHQLSLLVLQRKKICDESVWSDERTSKYRNYIYHFKMVLSHKTFRRAANRG